MAPANPLRRILPIAGVALAIVAVGVVGYRVVSGLDWLDALYMTVITLATVGYREVGEMDADAKIFTILLLVGGAGVVLWSVSAILEIIMDPQTRLYFEHRETARRTRNLRDHYIVCGLGRVGRAVAEELSARGAPFLVVELDPEAVAYSSSRGWLTVHGNATDDRVLEQAGVERAKGLITCVDSDAENLFIIVSAKAMNPKLTISTRANDDVNLDKFKRAGAHHAYSPYALLGRRIARTMTRPRVLEILDLALEQTNYDLTIDECEVPSGSDLAGKTLVDSNLRQGYGAFVLSIIRRDRSVVHNPPPETVIDTGDILILLGTPASLESARQENKLARA